VTATEGVPPDLPFSVFVATFRRRLVDGLALRWPAEDVEDAVQDAFIQAFQQWDTVKEMDSPNGWVARVAYRLLSRQARRDQKHGQILKDAVVDIAGRQTAADPGDQHCDRAQLKQALTGMKRSYAEVLVLHEALDFSVEVTAEILGLPANTVKTQLQRGRCQLQKILKSWEGGLP
jgi:RNA polymerase sigma-70 factor, ECF subfamily